MVLYIIICNYIYSPFLYYTFPKVYNIYAFVVSHKFTKITVLHDVLHNIHTCIHSPPKVLEHLQEIIKPLKSYQESIIICYTGL